MGRTAEGLARKRPYNLTLNVEIVEWVKKTEGIKNLSAFVDDYFRRFYVNSRARAKCKCGFVQPASAWREDAFKCPHCGHDHTISNQLLKLPSIEAF